MKLGSWVEVPLETIAARTRYPIGDGDHGAIKPAMYKRVCGIPYIRVADIADGAIVRDKLVYISPAVHQANPKSHLFPGDIVISKTGATIGKVAIVPPEMLEANTTSSVGKITIDPQKALSRFVVHYMRSPRFQSEMWAVSHKSAQPGFNIKDLKQFKIPLPPLAEQEWVVKLLDEADELRKLRAQADQRTEALCPSLLNELFSHPDSRKWKEYTFGDSTVLTIIDGDRGVNYPKKTDFSEEGDCLFLNTSNVRRGAFDFSKCDFITHKKDAELRKGKLLREDVILTTRGTLGNTAHYDHGVKFENVRINSGMVILRAKPSMLLPEYLLATLSSDGLKEQVVAMTSGSAQPQLPINILSKVKLVLPPISLQKNIVDRIGEIRTMQAEQGDSRQRLDDLFQSMLHRAFNGEL